MWYKTQSDVRPNETDTVSSSKYNYVRRNIIEKDGVFTYEEMKIDKESWEAYKIQKEQDDAIIEIANMASNNEIALAEVADALVELADMIVNKEEN